MNIYLRKAQETAESKGGKLLSLDYVNNRTKYDFECKTGHKFSLRLSDIKDTRIKKGTWCKVCFYDERRFRLDDIVKIAEAKGGKCLTEEIEEINNSNKIVVTLECDKGHQWSVRASNILRGSWCRMCARRLDRLDIDVDIKELLKEESDELEIVKPVGQNLIEKPIILRKNKIESNQKLEKVKNIMDKLKYELYTKDVNENRLIYFKCFNGHFTGAKYEDIINCQKNFCKECNNKIVYKSVNKDDDYNKLLKLFDGIGTKILTDKYYGPNINLPYECNNNHIWVDTPNNILNKNKSCQLCKGFLSERICTSLLEYIFDKPFKKGRYDWLTNTDGNKMELDMYNEELKLACEFNGIQHYRFVKYYHKTEEIFKKRVEADKLKAKLCEEKGIKLLVVPYKIRSNRMHKFIIDELVKLGYDIPKNKKIVDITSLPNIDTHHTFKLQKIKELAIEKGGVCLSEKYIDSSTYLEFKCKRNHEFKLTKRSLTENSWCKVCNLIEPRLEAIKNKAIEKDGKCLTDNYNHCRDVMQFECKNNHIFELVAEKFMVKNQWCKVCAKIEQN
jgi:hypothetical protein